MRPFRFPPLCGQTAKTQLPTSEMPLPMIRANPQWSFSNFGPSPILLWLEPWADEIEIPSGATVTVDSTGGSGCCPPGEIEWTDDHMVLWATARTNILGRLSFPPLTISRRICSASPSPISLLHG